MAERNDLSPEQVEYFKNSMVRDADGQLLELYHGSGTNITAFSPDYTGQGNDQYGSGFYFTTELSIAQGYTEAHLRGNDGVLLEKPGGEDSPTVISAYINLENPLIVDGTHEANLSHIFVSSEQAHEILKHLPSLYYDIADEVEPNPLGDYFDDVWETEFVQPQDFAPYIEQLAYQFFDDADLVKLENMFIKHPTEWREALHSVLGYDGVIVDFQDSKHVIAWFPEQIKDIRNRTPQRTVDLMDMENEGSVSNMARAKNDVCAAIKREIDIVEYARMVGLNPRPFGAQGKMNTVEHDSLVFSPNEGLFSWNSRSKGGSVIDFAMEYHGMSEREAIQHLRGYLNGDPQHERLQRNHNVEYRPAEKREFKAPEKSTQGYKRLFGYLVKTRLIDPAVVQKMVDEKVLYQDARNNACFCGYDYDGQMKYAALRTTSTEAQFRGEAAGSHKEVGFSYNLVGKAPVAVFVCEAPIDCMSIMSMLAHHGKDFTEYAYLALGGTHEGALLNHLEHHPQLKTVYLCQDNDEAGNKSRAVCRQKLQERGFSGRVVDKSPHANDFNDDLRTLRGHGPQAEPQHLPNQPKQQPGQIMMQEITQNFFIERG